MEKFIKIKVKLKSKKEYVKKISEKEFEVAVNEPPEKGKANKRVIELLAIYFDVSKREVNIIKGKKNRNKIIRVTLKQDLNH